MKEEMKVQLEDLTDQEEKVAWLREHWAVSSYNEGEEEEIEYFFNTMSEVGGDAYVYNHEDDELIPLKIIHMICNLDDMERYEELSADEDVLLNGESEYNADASCEVITDDACYLLWFVEKDRD